MKKLLALSLSVIALSACAAGTTTADSEQSPVTTQYVAPEPERGAAAYINNIASEYPELINNLGRQWLIDYANTTCDEIDNGMTLTQLAQMAVNNNVDAGMIGFLTGEAIRNFCPRNQWFIDAALSA